MDEPETKFGTKNFIVLRAVKVLKARNCSTNSDGTGHSSLEVVRRTGVEHKEGGRYDHHCTCSCKITPVFKLFMGIWDGGTTKIQVGE